MKLTARPVDTEYPAKNVRYFTDRGTRSKGRFHRRHQVGISGCLCRYLLQCRHHSLTIARSFPLRQTLLLTSFKLRVDRQDGYRGLLAFFEAIDSDDHRLAARLALGFGVCRVLDPGLHPTGFDGSYRPTHPLDLSQQILGSVDEALGEVLHQIRTPQRVGGSVDTGLVSDYLLRSQRKQCRLISGKPQRLVVGVGV